MTDHRGARPIAPNDPPPKRRRTAEQREADTQRIVELYKGDKRSIQEIADEIGLSYGTVRGALVDAEVELRGRGGNHHARTKRVSTT
jgi:DNA-directed RNA polymerase specialized sigma24 family protein